MATTGNLVFHREHDKVRCELEGLLSTCADDSVMCRAAILRHSSGLKAFCKTSKTLWHKFSSRRVCSTNVARTCATRSVRGHRYHGRPSGDTDFARTSQLRGEARPLTVPSGQALVLQGLVALSRVLTSLQVHSNQHATPIHSARHCDRGAGHGESSRPQRCETRSIEIP